MTISSTNEPIVYQLPKGSQARAIVPFDSADEEHSFLVGTCKPVGSSNEAHILRFKPELPKSVLEHSFGDQRPLLDITACGGDYTKFVGITIGKKGDDAGFHLSKFTISSSGMSLENDIGFMRERPTGVLARSDREIITSTPSELSVYDSVSSEVSKLNTAKCGAIALDSANESVVTFTSDRSVCLWDTRTKEVSLTMRTNHFFPIQCIDSNPNLDHVYVTGGSDGRILFWDLRQPSGSSPLASVGDAHAHHVTCVRYHPIHDQLLISSGTDCAVNLWRFQGVSATPTRSIPLTSPRTGPPTVVDDGLVESYKRHEDAVYRCCWSREGWSFASVSYDGLVMAHSVSTNEKYRILL